VTFKGCQEDTVQKGTIRRVGNIWMLRYYEPVLHDGRIVKRAKAKKLADYCDKYKTEHDVRPLADLILAPINAQRHQAESTQRLATFLDHVYMPHIKQTKKPSTIRSYADMFALVKPFLPDMEISAVRTSTVDRLIQAVADSKPRAHTTLRNVKSFLSGAFRYAKRTDAITENPVRDSVVPKGKPRGATPAVSLEQIQKFLTLLPEPAKTIVLVAAMTGLRKCEVMGLQWSDVIGDELHVNRSVYRGQVTDTKTQSSRAPVPLLPIVKKALEAHRKRTASTTYIFAGPKLGKPLHLENVVNRGIKPALKEAGVKWQGWHAFRRGVGTNLHALGADDLTISHILRHGNVGVTQSFYEKPVHAGSHKAMKKLEKALNKLK
jgi:integrase